MTWETQGHDNFIVNFLGTSGQKIPLVNEIPPDPASGQFFFPSPGGTFNFEIQASTLTWKVTFLQLVWPPNPKPEPPRSEIKLSGQNSTISDPVYLPAGNYKLSWTSQGHDNFIVTLHWGDTGERGLVNEIPPNPAAGEMAFDSGGGYHIFEVHAANQQWTITLTPL